MESTILKAQTRTVIAKGLNRLRRDGLLPGILYGTDMNPVALQLPAHEAGQILTRLQGTVLIDLEVDGQNHTTIVRELQRDVLTGHPLHVDFMAVDMEQVLTITVPISLVGESPAVATGEYTVMTSLYDLEVECLPKDMMFEQKIIKEKINVEVIEKGKGADDDFEETSDNTASTE